MTRLVTVVTHATFITGESTVESTVKSTVEFTRESIRESFAFDSEIVIEIA